MKPAERKVPRQRAFAQGIPARLLLLRGLLRRLLRRRLLRRLLGSLLRGLLGSFLRGHDE